MSTLDVLQGQVDVLRQELSRVRGSTQSLDLDAALRDRVAAPFERELSGLQKRVDALASRIGKSAQGCWQELRQLQKEADKVLDEHLAFIQGALARKASVDEGICALTDALLDDIAVSADIHWGRFTLLGASEFYRETAEIIRIRYPSVSLWSMPLAAHEFGHFVAPALHLSRDGGRVNPLKDLLEAADRNKPDGQLHSTLWHHLSEHFSDLFATYTLGPAYAAAFVMLRMHPEQAYAESYSHPSAAKRVHGILWTLDKMAERDASPLRRSFRDTTALIGDLWRECLRQEGQPDKLSDAASSLVAQRMDGLFDLLADTTPERLMYGWQAWNRASALAMDLEAQQLPAGLTRRDVLNAAWLVRLELEDQSPPALNAAGKSALAVFRRVTLSQPVEPPAGKP